MTGKSTAGATKTIRAALLAGIAACAAPAFAQPAPEVDGVEVTGRAERPPVTSPLYTQPFLDTPQTVTRVDEEVLREQGVVRLRDAMRNISGVSLVAGEGNPPSGDAMKIRGFAARDDILIDGMADIGNYLRDPFFVESIEITQGPSSAFAGRGNAGGTINLVTRRPVLDYIRRADLSVGTDNYYRAMVDANIVLSEEQGAALRINLMGHRSDEPGRDHVYNGRWGLNVSLAAGLETDTVVTMSLLHVEQNELPDLGIPNNRDITLVGSGYEGRPMAVDPSNFYGYRTDYRDIISDVITLRLEHDFDNGMSLMSQLRYGRTLNDSVVSAPRLQGASNSIGTCVGPAPCITAITPATLVNGLQKPRDEEDRLLMNQTNLTIPFSTGSWRHTFVTGFELGVEDATNIRRLDENGPAISLWNPQFVSAAAIPYQGTEAMVETETQAIYIFDNIELSPRWEVNFGARYDVVRTHVQSIDYTGTIPGFEQDLSRTDTEGTGNFSILFRPTENSSLYAGYATAFETVGRHDIVNIQGRTNAPPTTPQRFNASPERTRSVEVGARLELGQMRYSAALFRAERRNARTPYINANDPAAAVDGVHEVSGFTLGANGEIVDRWAVFANYTYLDGEVTSSSNPYEIGQRLDNLPQHSWSLWSTYQLNPRWRIGGGALYQGERGSNVAPNPTHDLVVRTPAYTVWDALVNWRFADDAELLLNVNNITDEEYFQAIQPGQSIPGPRRQVLLTLAFGF